MFILPKKIKLVLIKLQHYYFSLTFLNKCFFKCLYLHYNIEFRPVKNKFLSKLEDTVQVINNTKEVLVNADKSTNTYKMNKNAYNKYLTENITKTYKKPTKVRSTE